MTNIDWQKFDHLLMDSTSAPSIKHGLQPAGFSYAAYEAGSGTTTFGIENAWGIRDPSHHPLTNGSVHECDSMSKTLTALSMMYQISLVPDVSDAYKAYQAANGQQKDAKRQTWQDRVEHYLDQKIANYVLRSSGDSTDWSALPAVSTIRIKDLMMHTSGLSVHDVHGSPQVVGGGDDWSSIQKDLVAWSDAHYQSAQTHVPVFYSNTNFALLRYVIGLFNLITVCGVSPHEAHGEFHGTWIERDHVHGELYRDVTRGGLLINLPTPQPDIHPHGDHVWFFSEDHSTSWDIISSQTDWALVAGAWGWKLTARQYAHVIAGVIAGTIMPAEYWKLMLSYTDNAPSGYGMAIYTVGSAHSEIGKYYSHNGGDGNDLGSGGGAWFEWDDKVLVILGNSPCKAPYGIDADGNDQSGGYLFTAMDNALAAAAS